MHRIPFDKYITVALRTPEVRSKLAEKVEALGITPDKPRDQQRYLSAFGKLKLPNRVRRLNGRHTTRTLIVVGSGLGNLVNTLPYLSYMRRAHPETELWLFVSKSSVMFADLFIYCNDIDILVIDESNLHGIQFDVAIYQVGSDFSFLPINAKQVYYLNYAWNYNLEGRHIPESALYLRAYLATCNLRNEPSDIHPIIHLPVGKRKISRRKRRFIVGISDPIKGSYWGKRAYPHIRVLSDLLIDAGITVYSLGLPKEAIPNAENKCSNDLLETIKNLQKIDAFIAADSGLCHLADAIGIPTIQIFGPTAVTKNAVAGHNSWIVAGTPPCAPCQFRADILYCKSPVCLSDIDPSTIYDLLTTILNGSSWGGWQKNAQLSVFNARDLNSLQRHDSLQLYASNRSDYHNSPKKSKIVKQLTQRPYFDPLINNLNTDRDHIISEYHAWPDRDDIALVQQLPTRRATPISSDRPANSPSQSPRNWVPLSDYHGYVDQVCEVQNSSLIDRIRNSDLPTLRNRFTDLVSRYGFSVPAKRRCASINIRRAVWITLSDRLPLEDAAMQQKIVELSNENYSQLRISFGKPFSVQVSKKVNNLVDVLMPFEGLAIIDSFYSPLREVADLLFTTFNLPSLNQNTEKWSILSNHWIAIRPEHIDVAVTPLRLHNVPESCYDISSVQSDYKYNLHRPQSDFAFINHAGLYGCMLVAQAAHNFPERKFTLIGEPFYSIAAKNFYVGSVENAKNAYVICHGQVHNDRWISVDDRSDPKRLHDDTRLLLNRLNLRAHR